MLRFDRILPGRRLDQGGQSVGHGAFVRPRGRVRRHWFVSTTGTLALIAGAVVLWSPWHTPPPPPPTPLCGPGLTATGSPYICVGLDVNSTPLRSTDPIADLERAVANHNAKITGAFATIVLLEDMTPDPITDSVTLQVLRHEIEGALTAADRANNSTGQAGGNTPQIKLLLANFGTRAAYWPQTVGAIVHAPIGEHITAVAGIGQSLQTTQAAVAALSAAHITTVGADVTADNMNTDSSGAQIQDFFRVAPTNSDEVDATAQYIKASLPHQRILLIQDDNQSDIYAQTLAAAFKRRSPPHTPRASAPPRRRSAARAARTT